MKFKAEFFDSLTARELYEIVRARQEIFLMEQNIVCRDFDGVDYDSLHCFLWEGEQVVAYLRAYKLSDNACGVGRVLSRTHGIGLGKKLMKESIPIIAEKIRCNKILIHSQCHAENFYKKLGFKRISDVFLEEGIEHVSMSLDI